MTGQGVNIDGLVVYTPEQLGEVFHTPPSTFKKLAQRRKIPFVMVGGKYRFTEQQVQEIVSILEQRPEQKAKPATVTPASPRRASRTTPVNGTTTLTARKPRRRSA